MAMRLNQVPVEERDSCPLIGINNNNYNIEGNSENDILVEAVDSVDDDEYNSVFEDRSNVGSVDTQIEIQQLKRELELITREKNLLQREKDLLIRQGTLSSNSNASAQIKTMPLTILKEFVAEFDGTSDAGLWTQQLMNLGRAYQVDDETLRALLVSKLKGGAQKWLYTMPDFATLSVTSLIKEVVEIFETPTDTEKF